MQFFIKATRYGFCFNGRWLIFGKVPDHLSQLNDTKTIKISIRISNKYNYLDEVTGVGKSWLLIQVGDSVFVKGYKLMSYDQAIRKFGCISAIIGRN